MNIKAISETMLFRGMTESETEACLDELKAREKNYKKGEFILNAGDTTTRMGLVLTGSVTIENNDVWGNCTILSHVGQGQLFAETYALIPDQVMLVDVRANEDCKVLFISASGLQGRDTGTSWRNKLVRNLLMISAYKNLALSGRSFHTSPKSARGRIISFLNTVSIQMHSAEFDIPFNRQQLADYLNLERTNMCKELGRMKKDGLIDFWKNHFRLITDIYSRLHI